LDILLDTHTFLWLAEDNPLLSATAKTLIRDTGTKSVLSFVSIWELAIKTSSGKLNLAGPLEVYISTQVATNKIIFMEITLESIYKVADLPYHHRDPFDRLLIAQALTENIPIVSGDAIFDAYGITRIW
jgi:PIN domain nuclease of toxin-antitoxin system